MRLLDAMRGTIETRGLMLLLLLLLQLLRFDAASACTQLHLLAAPCRSYVELSDVDLQHDYHQ